MPIVRKREVENLAQMNGEELEAFLVKLPAGKEDIEDLFEFLESRLERDECDHTLRYTMRYIMENRLDFPKLSAWLQRNGGFCDCKVIEQITPEWRKAFPFDNAANGER